MTSLRNTWRTLQKPTDCAKDSPEMVDGDPCLQYPV